MTKEHKSTLVSETGAAALIGKPKAFNLDRFKSTQPDNIAGVETLLTGLPIHSLSDAKDFVRLHPDKDTYWTDELCFVHVPIKGQKHDHIHLVDEALAMRHLPSNRILRFRLALASKPYDVFFLCKVPTRQLKNTWNETNLKGCEQAKTLWTQATSQKAEGKDSYKIDRSRDPDAFPEPRWPTQSLNELIQVSLIGRMIEEQDHPALLRLIGAKQSLT